ncbi:MAG: polyhydroxyalkanoate synthesis regulator DNA-binding domain-containing protein [Gemmataceae bacterium]
MASDNNQQESTGSDVVTIIRYPNRRLYNRKESRYSTLSNIQELIRNGQTIQVLDSKSGEDLTRAILTQIILDQHPERMELFPVSFLHWMIRTNDLALEVFRNYFHQSLKFLNMIQSSPLNPLSVPPMQWMQAFSPVPASELPGIPQGAESETERLAEKLVELEKRLAELSSTQSAEPEAPEQESTPKKKSKKKKE